MAKKQGQAEKKKQTSSQGPQESGRRSYWYMGLIGLALAAWTVWRLQPSQGLERALLFGAVAFLAWGVFIVGYYLSQRMGGDKDE